MKSRFIQRACYFLFMRFHSSNSATADKVRAFLLRKMTGIDVDGLHVRVGVYISGYRNLRFGTNVSLNPNCFLSCEGGLDIGNEVSIAHGVSVLTAEHGFSDPKVPIKFQEITYRPVVIGNNVWIGAKATILAGVNIADGTIIAAGAVVTKSITQENTIVGGVPARFLKNRLGG
jgi:acetyltransferase-like isoleucine patch superfamily enzyme